MAIKKVLGSPNFNEIPGQPLTADGGGQALTMSHTPSMSTVPAGAHGAVAPKPTNVSAMTPMGSPVNPGNTNGRSGDRGVWQGETDWVTTSNTHA